MKARLFGICVATILGGYVLGCTSSEPSRRGTPGTAGNGTTAGTAGTGTPGAAGSGTAAGTAGTSAGTAGSGAAGDTGATGTAGASGAAGSTAGAAGTTAGTAGTAGASGSAGTAGASGTAGTAGASGSAGTAGASGSAGTAGATGAGGSQVPGTYTGKPLGGTPQTIPGTIQIENYDTGGEGVAYHDQQVVAHGQLCGVTRTDLIDLNCTGQPGSPTDKNEDMACANEMPGEEYLGYISTGDWLNYTVTVQQAGTYAISAHVGVAGTTKLMFTFTPTVKTAALALTNSAGCGVEAYHVWQTEKNLGTIALEPGTYVMRLDFVAATLNIDWVAFTKM